MGCGDSSGRLAISGSVTFDGEPVTNGNIGFVASDTANGKTVGADIVDGQYTIARDQGPMTGTYKVMIYAERPTGRKIQADEGSQESVDQLIQYIPMMYNDRSTLKVDLTEDRENLDFNLEKPAQKRGRR